MNKTLALVLGLVLAGGVVAGIVLPTSSDVVQGPQGPKGEQGLRGPQGLIGPRGLQGIQGPAGKDAASLGAVVGPENYLPYWSMNGHRLFESRTAFNTATSNICSAMSPSSTSTLQWFNAAFSNASTTDLKVGLFKNDPKTIASSSANQIGTDLLMTKVGVGNVEDDVLTVFVASTTNSQNVVLPPNTVVSLIGGVGPATQAYEGQATDLTSGSKGFCDFVFENF